MGAQAVIFDMDGVLVDSYWPHLRSWQESCQKRGLYIDKDIYDRLFGRPFSAFAREIAGDRLSPAELQEWYEEKEALYRVYAEEDFPENEGAAGLVEHLWTEGFRLAIGSSGPRENVECIVRKLPSGHRFHTTVNGDEVKNGKPAPDVFLRAAEKLGVRPENCVVVEDSLPGLEAARAAGMKSVGITGTATREDLQANSTMVIESLRELSAQVVRGLLDKQR